ncbi:hypothetical protein HXX76_012583 [Chlamydomonas incerta]|uniref:Protein kinase domain-containing protein n=1 Tax=Chlamydomonas incerta TaxID=51695 RepID=A0A835SRR3_CHLIN|nr:hypothetical protein HXX76_012583 [Chlamydomonas incerta]|eukprot:KAG2427069.1 hypothetical protein HXX76_012583 [Chlamydomonas incerta]
MATAQPHAAAQLLAAAAEAHTHAEAAQGMEAQQQQQPVLAAISEEEKLEKACAESFLRACGLSCCRHVKQLGCGGFGRADLVSVKYPPCGGGGKLRAREVRAMRAGAGHPNIIQIYDSCTPAAAHADRPHAILMEYAAGGCLADFLLGERQHEMERQFAAHAKELVATTTVSDILRLQRASSVAPLMPWAHLRAFIRGLLGALQQLHAQEAAPAAGGSAAAAIISEDAPIAAVSGSPGWCSLEVASLMAKGNSGGHSAHPITLKSDMASLGLVVADIIGLRYSREHQAYLHGRAQLSDYTPPGLADLVAQLTRPVPCERPSPAAALQHAWLQQG